MSALILLSIASGCLFFAQKIWGSTNIDATDHWAWNDIIGWIDLYSTNSVTVSPDKLEGYASTSSGDIAFDCATGPTGSSCSPVNYFVTNDGSGKLSGWGWSDTVGWISFCGNAAGGSTWNGTAWVCPASPTYQVKVLEDGGQFSGWAWSDTVGWVSFNCSQEEIGDTCAVSDYKVLTAWLPTAEGGNLISSTFVTQYNSAIFNNILWRGTSNNGSVCFQFAASSSSTGPWEFTGPGGTGLDSDVACAAADTPVAFKKANLYDGKRYFRYKIFVSTDAVRSGSPVITDVIVNWSP